MVIKDKGKSPFDFGDSLFVKAVVDVKREALSMDCDLHYDCVEELVKDGSKYPDLWGANIYPEEKRIDFISLINIRPAQKNRSMDIEDPTIKKRVEDIIKNLLF